MDKKQVVRKTVNRLRWTYATMATEDVMLAKKIFSDFKRMGKAVGKAVIKRK